MGYNNNIRDMNNYDEYKIIFSEEYSSSVIQWAAESGHLCLVKLIARDGIDDYTKIIAIGKAYRNNHFDIVEYLINLNKK